MKIPIRLQFLAVIFFPSVLFSQNKYWVTFTDKRTAFDPYSYFDSKAIGRRVQQGLPLCDSTDFPVNGNYIELVKRSVDSVAHCSRWLNGIAVYASPGQVETLRSCPFIKMIEPMRACPFRAASLPYSVADTSTLLKKQIESMQGERFITDSLHGKGIRIAIFDVGFWGVENTPYLKHVRSADRIIKTWDFVKNIEYVYGVYETHGTEVFSCIAGKDDDNYIGLATESEFLLARIARGIGDRYSVEDNWLAAVEWADKNGANIISNSGGHDINWYFYEEMDGKTSLLARAANLAAKKGILVVTSTGNNGDQQWKEWRHIATPADADSALSVGGIAFSTGYSIPFSSRGPTADKRLKPNVCAFAEAMVAHGETLGYGSGTSYSCPLVAGFAACAWQKNRSLSNMQLLHEIEKSGSLYPYFDYAHGYGVPQASHFFNASPLADTTFDLTEENDLLRVVVRNKYLPGNSKCEGEKILYYHIENSKGVIDDYYVVAVSQQNVLKFLMKDYKKGQKLMVHYQGFTRTYTF